MASNIPHIRGENVVLKFYQQDGAAMKPVYMAAKNWDLEENASEINEGVNGEDRDRLDKVTNFYSGSVDMYQSDLVMLDAYNKSQAAFDGNTIPLRQSFAVMIKQADGVNKCWLCKEAVVGPFKKSQSGRAEAVMLNMKFRFRYFVPVQSI